MYKTAQVKMVNEECTNCPYMRLVKISPKHGWYTTLDSTILACESFDDCMSTYKEAMNYYKDLLKENLERGE